MSISLDSKIITLLGGHFLSLFPGFSSTIVANTLSTTHKKT